MVRRSCYVTIGDFSPERVSAILTRVKLARRQLFTIPFRSGPRLKSQPIPQSRGSVHFRVVNASHYWLFRLRRSLSFGAANLWRTRNAKTSVAPIRLWYASKDEGNPEMEMTGGLFPRCFNRATPASCPQVLLDELLALMNRPVSPSVN